MNKILSIEQAIKIAEKLRKQKKSIILAGGCFDILHIGHINFFKKAKQQGNILFVLLESDETISKIKGNNRPINNQKDRAEILAALSVIDYVITIPPLESDQKYDNIVLAIKPDIIATTKGDPNRIHKERQARLAGGKVFDVIEKVSNKSTTNLIKLLHELENL